MKNNWKNLLVAALIAMPFTMGSAYAAEAPVNDAVSTVAASEINFFGAKDLREVEVAGVAGYHNNPFGLVYEGAITENVAGKVNIHPVNYNLNGNTVAANIYTPAGYDKNDGKKYAAIVVAHPNGGVKEQVAGLYAQRLAEQGYITIAADASFQGASGGQPRHLDNPAFRVEDIHGMLDIIASFPGVDADRLGALGICGGGGYTLKATQTDKRAKAVATISMFNSGLVRKNGYTVTKTPADVYDRLAAAGETRAAEAAGAEVKITAGMENMEIPQETLDSWTSLYREGYLYYGKTHRHPNSTFSYTVRSNMDLFTFDAADNMELINQPLLMIAGSEADSLYMTKAAFKKATGTKDKELFLVKDATHIQTYYVPEYVDQISDKLTSFYGANL